MSDIESRGRSRVARGGSTKGLYLGPDLPPCGGDLLTTDVHCTGKRTHRRWIVREAAKEFAENGKLAPCSCGASRVIEVTHNKPKGSVDNYLVVRVARLFSDKEAEKEGYEPMAWALRSKDGDEVLQAVYWTKNRYDQWWWGEHPPVLAEGHLRTLLGRLGLAWA